MKAQSYVAAFCAFRTLRGMPRFTARCGVLCVDFCPVELPGRAARLHEPPFTSRSWSIYSSRSWKCHSVFLTTAWASAWPLRLPGNCARSRAATPCFCSFPAAGVPNSLPPIAPGTPAVGPRFACNSAPVWRHACSSHATTGTHSCATAGLKSRSRARYGVCGRSGGSHYLSYHRICRRRRCRSFRFPAVLARLHPRKFSRTAFLLLSRGSRSRQGDHPGRACIRGHARARCEIVDMTHPCVDRPALAIGEIHVWTARLVDEHCATADLLRAQAAQFSFELARHGDWDCLRVQRSVSI